MFRKTRNAISTAVAIGIIVIIVVAGVAAYAFYTSSTTTSTTTTPAQPVTLTLITFTDPATGWMQWAGTQFAQQHPGVTVNVVGQSFGQYLQTEITAEKTNSSTYDILGYTSTSSFSLLPYLKDLGASSYNSSDVPFPQLNFGGTYHNATSGSTEIIGLPWDSATFTLFYRTDVFDNASLNSQFQAKYGVGLDPHNWNSWQDALDADNFLVNQTHIFQYGILTDAQEAHDIIDTFPALFGSAYAADSSLNGGTTGGLLNYNIMFKGSASSGIAPAPSFNNSAGASTLQLYYQLVKYDPQPFGTEINYGLIGTTFASGKAAGAIMFTPENSALVGKTSNVTGKYNVANFPGNYAETGTDFVGVSKFSQHQALAKQFVEFLLSPQINAHLLYQTGEFPISKAAVGLVSQNSTVPQWLRTLDQNVFGTASVAWANPPNLGPTYSALIPDFNTAVYTYLQGDGSAASAQAALNTAAAAWAKAVG